MSKRGNAPSDTQQQNAKENKKPVEEPFQWKKLFQAFTDFPRILQLVWTTSWQLTTTMAAVSFARGILPAVSVGVTGGLIDSIIRATFSPSHHFTMVWFYVGIQTAIGIVQGVLGMWSSIAQQLLQERMAHQVDLLILEKANQLDLFFFEDAEFYNKLRRASDEATYKPVQIVTQVFDLVKTVVTLVSMLFLLLQLAWWLAILSLVLPIPSFLSSSRYSWRNYLKMRSESPDRRKMLYLDRLLTTDTYNVNANRQAALLSKCTFFTFLLLLGM